MPTGTAGGINTWNTWVASSSTTTSTCTTNSSSTVWIQWANCTSVGHQQYNTYQYVETAEERAAREASTRERLEREKAAKDRAKELLMQNLTPKQRAQLEKNGWFIVQGGKSKKLYRIHADRIQGNVYELRAANDNVPVASYCAHTPHGSCPTDDCLLAQKLMLEAAEDEFLRIANRRAA